eukprot:3934122-Rhodomonas_salina.1
MADLDLSRATSTDHEGDSNASQRAPSCAKERDFSCGPPAGPTRIPIATGMTLHLPTSIPASPSEDQLVALESTPSAQSEVRDTPEPRNLTDRSVQDLIGTLRDRVFSEVLDKHASLADSERAEAVLELSQGVRKLVLEGMS